MSANSTLQSLLALAPDEAAALRAPGAPPLSFGRLRTLVEETVVTLNGLGVGRGDRVAIVLPNGPEMAAAFIAIAQGATAAPLNPAYKLDEFEFYMQDLRAKALVVEAGSLSPAIEAARKLGLLVLTLTPRAGGAGDFALSGASRARADAPGFAAPEDIALILHTSGTTSRPKIVPLSQRSLAASAQNVARTLELSPADRALNVMPLFHIHGLVAGLLAPLSRGGSIFCAPGFNALKFFAWMEEAEPTWYTAVPTMHQAILTRVAKQREVIAQHPLRFIRSSSASLPPQVIAELEATFHAPVVEAYGMTEAAHQMACNPLHGVRKPGSVGPAAGPEIEIMDMAGGILAPGVVGEIVIRGENVFGGYENNPKANAEAFANGWFRTGDQGVKDADGYVRLTGRLKEIINRGGEKISPREVDEALMDHPAVQQVVAFAMPHERLGEDVAAAVVLREGASVTEGDLRAFLAERLAAFKVPRKILFLREIPKGATGKLQRIGLAEKLGLAG
ncbi:acyl--CoA ligase [Methylocystis bryophila]|uniref:AMP-dependent synthetase n=1 Tax=Methylocystis bryophila TaxID=655015 RepID=A0A1W6N008_9HYPH|nr:acyl--CoA ligase [Methylocystis bryophila]ARN83162.1 AMP-dependent synthetase [Methylocystis bryophila]BDV39493.1 AMP-dependent synthetase [Methylocystis bryophila]